MSYVRGEEEDQWSYNLPIYKLFKITQKRRVLILKKINWREKRNKCCASNWECFTFTVFTSGSRFGVQNWEETNYKKAYNCIAEVWKI